jgi:hypothetical protein
MMPRSRLLLPELLGVFLLLLPSLSNSFNNFLRTHQLHRYHSAQRLDSLSLPFTRFYSSLSILQLSTVGSSGSGPSYYASDLLYAEQEKLIVKRGIMEESLVTNATPLLTPPSSVIKVRGVGKAGGFGGSSNNNKSNNKSLSSTNSNNKSSSSYKAEGKAYAKIVTDEGLVRIDNVLSSNTANQLRKYVYELRHQSEQDVMSGKVQPIQRFAHVLLKHNRCDLTIPLGGGNHDDDDNEIMKKNEIVTVALLETLIQSPVGAIIEALFGNDAILHEFSCLMSDSGSQRQVLHPDTPFVDDGRGAVLYTCFIALQDVTMDMGPTTWLPRTHTKEIHDRFKDSTAVKVGDAGEGDEDGDGGGSFISSKDHLIKTQPAVLGLLPKGSCVIFDSRVLHCGTANRSNDSRALFYFSFKNPKVGRYTGNPASIRKELGDAKVTLGSLMEDLISFGRGKGTPLIDRLGSLMS